FVQGGPNFRPVGLAVAPDGSLYVSDWVRSDYNLHGQGAIWHLRWPGVGKPDRPADPRKALLSAHRPLRESAARQLAGNATGRAVRREHLRDPDVRVRAACLAALADAGGHKSDLGAAAAKDPSTPLRALAVRALAARGEDAGHFLAPGEP